MVTNDENISSEGLVSYGIYYFHYLLNPYYMVIKFYLLHFTGLYTEASTGVRTFSKLAQPVNQTLSLESLSPRSVLLNQGPCVPACACVCACDNMKQSERRMDGPRKMLVTWRKKQTCFKDFWLERLFDRHPLPRPPVTPFFRPLTQSVHVANSSSIRHAPYFDSFLLTGMGCVHEYPLL